MNRQKMLKQTIVMRTGKEIMNREGEYWDTEEKEVLRVKFLAGIPVNEIAIELERSEDEVYQQIKDMHLYTAPSGRRYKRYSTFGGHVRFCYAAESDPVPSSCLLFQRRFQGGYINV